jgi:hypothetical protein
MREFLGRASDCVAVAVQPIALVPNRVKPRSRAEVCRPYQPPIGGCGNGIHPTLFDVDDQSGHAGFLLNDGWSSCHIHEAKCAGYLSHNVVGGAG